MTPCDWLGSNRDPQVALSFYEAMFQKGLIASGLLRLTIYIVAVG